MAKPESRRLGKGLGALLGEYLEEPTSGEIPIRELDVGRIRPNPFQPRRQFQDDSLDELEASIARQPSSVVYVDNPNNQTGQSFPLDDMETLARTLEDKRRRAGLLLRGTSLAAFAGVALATSALVITLALMSGYSDAIAAALQRGNAHIVGFSGRPLDAATTRAMADSIETVDGVRRATPVRAQRRR